MDASMRAAPRRRLWCLWLLWLGAVVPAAEAFSASRFRASARWGVVVRGLRIVDAEDTSFSLEAEAEDKLRKFLAHSSMRKEVAEQAGIAGTELSFTGHIFKPVGYSLTTPHGMPEDLEHFHESPNHIVCHIPPVVLFKSKIFKPSRLCAVYEIAEAPTMDLAEDTAQAADFDAQEQAASDEAAPYDPLPGMREALQEALWMDPSEPWGSPDETGRGK